MGFGEDKDGVSMLYMLLNRLQKRFRLLRIARERQSADHRLYRPKELVADRFIRAQNESASRRDKPNGDEEAIADRGVVTIDEKAFLPHMGFPEFPFSPNPKAIYQMADDPKERNGDDIVDKAAEKPIYRRLVVELEILRKRLVFEAFGSSEVVVKQILIINGLFLFHRSLFFTAFV